MEHRKHYQKYLSIFLNINIFIFRIFITDKMDLIQNLQEKDYGVRELILPSAPHTRMIMPINYPKMKTKYFLSMFS